MLDFPASPTTGQIYNGTNGVTYRWDGTIWLASGASAGGDFYATQNLSIPMVGTTFITMTPPLITGSGGFYNVTNGRYTPPAGRYYLHADVSGNTSAASTNWFGVQIRKNGVVVQDNYDGTGSSWYGFTSISVILDANGSDWFDAQYACMSTTTTIDSITFLAFPISGIKGPPGDPYSMTQVGGDFCALGSNMAVAAAGTVMVPTVILSGNANGSYSASTGRYIPPAGRYCIYATITSNFTAATNVTLTIRKNGIGLQSSNVTTAASGFQGAPALSLNVDANGTDYFEMFAANGGGAGTAAYVTFGAFPLSGIKGPPGDATPGTLIQMASTQTGAVATSTAQVPGDDTIPQIGEGVEYMTLAFTPKSATSNLVIEVTWLGSNSAINNQIVSLFKDATANALASSMTGVLAAAAMINVKFTHIMTSGSTAASTFRVRAGGSAAGTTTFNGTGGIRYLGGAMASSIVIREVAP